MWTVCDVSTRMSRASVINNGCQVPRFNNEYAGNVVQEISLYVNVDSATEEMTMDEGNWTSNGHAAFQ
jgi:hypothetical protein